MEIKTVFALYSLASMIGLLKKYRKTADRQRFQRLYLMVAHAHGSRLLPHPPHRGSD